MPCRERRQRPFEPSAFASTEFSSRRQDSTDRALLPPKRIALGESPLCGNRETQAHLRHDLDLFLDRVAHSLQTAGLEMPTEPMMSLDQVSKKFQVSAQFFWRSENPARHALIPYD